MPIYTLGLLVSSHNTNKTFLDISHSVTYLSVFSEDSKRTMEPTGFRFHPTDEELIKHFLYLKKLGYDGRVSGDIGELDICKFEPWELPQLAATQSDDYTWHFFSRPDYKYKNSKRANRRTKGGYWKVTGKERKIVDENNKEIGTKKTLVFYKGNVPNGVKTSWVIHEFHSNMNYSGQRDVVVCRLKQQPDGSTDDSIYEQGQPSQYAGQQQMEPQFRGNSEYSSSGYSSAQQLGNYMWREGPSYGNYYNGY